MTDAVRPVVAELSWSHDLRFDAAMAGGHTIPLDGQTSEGPSPVQLLTVALAGCMGMDVVDILRKGRHPVTSFACTISGDRRATPPKRFLAFTMHFRIGGAVPDAAVVRAIDLSRERYCSVWHSLREDISLTTTFTITP
jgi:putative redox protein